MEELNVELTCDNIENLMELLNDQCNDFLAFGSDRCAEYKNCEGCPRNEVFALLSDLYHTIEEM